jgi:hypothetical protein
MSRMADSEQMHDIPQCCATARETTFVLVSCYDAHSGSGCRYFKYLCQMHEHAPLQRAAITPIPPKQTPPKKILSTTTEQTQERKPSTENTICPKHNGVTEVFVFMVL